METNKDLNFLTIADENYAEPLLFSIQQVLKLYPEARFYVYDWGLAEKTVRKILDTGRASLITWEPRLVKLDIQRDELFVMKKGLSFLRDALQMLLGIKKESSSLKKILNTHDFEVRVFNKFLCLQDFNKRKKENFVFLDADAFLINKIDEVFTGKFDIGVTIRRKNEISFKYNKCEVLNVGVLFFLGGFKKNTLFLDAWYKQLIKNQENNCEQTALTRLLDNIKPGVFDQQHTIHEINLENAFIKVAVLPCEIYNFNWIEDFDPERDGKNVKILHFKSGRFRTPLFKEIAQKLGI